jgi:hypothetical protein
VVEADERLLRLLQLHAGVAVEVEPGVVLVLVAADGAGDGVDDDDFAVVDLGGGEQLEAAGFGVEVGDGGERQVAEVVELVGCDPMACRRERTSPSGSFSKST